MGTPAFTWGDLLDYCQHAPRDSQLAYAVHGETVLWGVTDHLLAAVVDALNAANWQRGGGKGPRPKPVKRPGVDDGSKTLGSQPIAIKDFDAWWDGD